MLAFSPPFKHIFLLVKCLDHFRKIYKLVDKPVVIFKKFNRAFGRDFVLRDCGILLRDQLPEMNSDLVKTYCTSKELCSTFDKLLF